MHLSKGPLIDNVSIFVHCEAAGHFQSTVKMLNVITLSVGYFDHISQMIPMSDDFYQVIYIK